MDDYVGEFLQSGLIFPDKQTQRCSLDNYSLMTDDLHVAD